jgi:hypothetical protein
LEKHCDLGSFFSTGLL